ncbi:MAG: hypothetical protein DRP65_01245 [Planctomycetota bacterium]|nr:MAG: hypothetical protein DRP65_01245 [Planctomycetota bacterium]
MLSAAIATLFIYNLLKLTDPLRRGADAASGRFENAKIKLQNAARLSSPKSKLPNPDKPGWLILLIFLCYTTSC